MTIKGKPSTYVKSFFADSVQSAMAQAQAEMGPDALLLISREAPPEARHLGDYEVVFGAGPEAPLPAAPTATGDVAAIRRQVEDIRDMLTRMAPAAPVNGGPADAVAESLMEAGVDSALARKIGEAARQQILRLSVPRIGFSRPAPASDPSCLLLAAGEEISARFEVAPEIGRVTALIGPPGAGKTTTLIKLAVAQGLACGRAVRLVSTDTHRIGGADQLRTYAGILGVNFQVAESSVALAQAIETAPRSALVLIDTPGLSPAMLNELGGDLAGFLSSRQDIDTHLVLTASTRIEDLYRTASRYNSFGPSKLLFTRVDETTSLAAAFCAAVHCNKPLSFLSNGQSVPEDLAPATKERIVASLVRQLPSPVEAVA